MEEAKHKIDSIGSYLAIYVTLLLLLIGTLAAARFDLGTWNVVVALCIAAIKALLVILFFMHVRHSSRLTWIFVCAAFFWLSILLTLTLGEYIYRARPYESPSIAPYIQSSDR